MTLSGQTEMIAGISLMLLGAGMVSSPAMALDAASMISTGLGMLTGTAQVDDLLKVLVTEVADTDGLRNSMNNLFGIDQSSDLQSSLEGMMNTDVLTYLRGMGDVSVESLTSLLAQPSGVPDLVVSAVSGLVGHFMSQQSVQNDSCPVHPESDVFFARKSFCEIREGETNTPGRDL